MLSMLFVNCYLGSCLYFNNQFFTFQMSQILKIYDISSAYCYIKP